MPRGNSKTDMRFFESFRRDGNDLAMKQACVYAAVHQGKE